LAWSKHSRKLDPVSSTGRNTKLEIPIDIRDADCGRHKFKIINSKFKDLKSPLYPSFGKLRAGFEKGETNPSQSSFDKGRGYNFYQSLRPLGLTGEKAFVHEGRRCQDEGENILK
jgi:hypothetical protein